MAKKTEKIIKNSLNSIFMKKVIAEKGWTKQAAKNKLMDFITCGKPISLAGFMENA